MSHRLTTAMILMSAAALQALPTHAAEKADTTLATISYRQGSSTYSDEFNGNRETVGGIRSAIDRGNVKSIKIISSASPEGSAAFNQVLSERRTDTALDIIYSITDTVKVYTQSIGVDREEGLRASRFFLITEQPLLVTPATADTLQPALTETLTVEVSMEAQPGGASDDFTPAAIAPHKVYRLGLRTNLLYDVAAVPNLGIEINMGRGWMVNLDGYYADWHNTARSRYWRVQGAELAARKYLRAASPSKWYLEVYTQLFRYNICLGHEGQLSSHSGARFFDKPTLGAGVAAGWSLRLANCWRMDFALGAGYVSGQYQTYRPTDGHLLWQSTRSRHYFGLSKAEITLVWMFGKGGKS